MKNNFEQHLHFPFQLLLVVLFFLICPTVFSQTIQFERIPNELGLSQNLISALLQDHQGFIWVGTKDGLNRFDGYRFRVFQHDPFDSTTISDNTVTSILEDRQGRFWVGTANGLNLLDRKTWLFERIYASKKIKEDAPAILQNHPGLSSGHIQSLMEDREGNIWAGTLPGEVVKIELPPGAETFENARFTIFRPTAGANSLWGNGIKIMEQDEEGTIWVHTKDQLCLIQPTGIDGGYQIKRLHWEDFDPQWPNYRQEDFLSVDIRTMSVDHRFYTIFKDEMGAIWVVSAGGFAKWLPAKKRYKLFPLDVDLSNFEIPPMLSIMGKSGFIDAKGRIWIEGFGNLVVYDTLSHQLLARFHRKDPATPAFLRMGSQALLEDSNGNIWIGTNGNGLFKHSPHQRRFSGQAEAKLVKSGSIRSIYQTKDGTVWAATVDPKMLQVNLKTGSIQPVILDKVSGLEGYAFETHQVYSMQEDQSGNLWMGGAKGLLRIPILPEAETPWENFKIYEDFEYPNVFDLHIESDSSIWLLTHSEFGEFDPATGQFDGHNFLGISGGEKIMGSTIPVLFRQNENTFWIGTDRGLLKYDVPSESFSFLTNDPQNPNSLSHPVVKSILPDPKEPEHILWIGTGGSGLNRFDLETGLFTHFTKKDGLPDDVIYGILDDEAGHLWMSTNQGLSRFNLETRVFKNYTAKDGLQDNEFNSGAYFKGQDGRLFFGGIGGFNAFLSSAVKDNEFVPPIAITDFKLANQSVDFKAADSPLKTAISQTQELVLTWKHNIFSFEFASLDFTEPGKNQYAYKLEGFDDEWQYIGTQRSATFTNIDPGEYTFRVKGTNHDPDGHRGWNEEGTSLKITILPPWWKTWWAYFGYVLLLGVAGYSFYKFQLNRKLEHAEAERLKEMDSLKTRLYTNITHEFRTPLTVIMGMNENIPGAENERRLIRRNSKNLLRLVNQLLDLSKLDSGSMKMDLVQGDVVNYLRYLTESFHSMAQEKSIGLRFQTEEPELVMDFDEVKLQHIVYNLLSNAIKFTPKGGEITLLTRQVVKNGQPHFCLNVQDNGAGIPAEQLPHIFDRFFQADSSTTRKGEGTGIGLALTKELVGMMGGSIRAKSDVKKGTEFIVLLPVNREAGTPFSESDYLTSQSLAKELVPDLAFAGFEEKGPNELVADDDKPLLLLIEDNRDVIAYLVSILKNDYQIVTAEDGQAGIEMALETIPDIIISDVMMPCKDGFEVCQALKTDERTSHIPIVLLTAKADDEAKIKGLRTGADAYLMKPFNKEELFVRLEKLIELRRALQERYAGGEVPDRFDKSSRFVKSEESAELTLDDIFMQKIHQAIAEKMDDSGFGIDDLCQVVNLSSTQVFRKMKALTGESPVRFIQKMRLRKAKTLLQTTELNVSEIAYEVGFTDPGYFSRAFGKEFGMSPSTFRK